MTEQMRAMIAARRLLGLPRRAGHMKRLDDSTAKLSARELRAYERELLALAAEEDN